ncbi:zinc finger E-box-binding homeobox 1-like, partial [Scleropages formosus]
MTLKDECGSDGEDAGSTDAMVEEMLQQGDTAVIYPEAPEDEPRQGTPEPSGHDENGTSPHHPLFSSCSFSELTEMQLDIRATGGAVPNSTRQHVSTPDAFSQLLTCPYCSRGYKRYTSLKEHIKVSVGLKLSSCLSSQRHVTQAGANRKFKCTECAKAFKYKHHLKEHLRIHSGEKPYECSNCKKRFSHSGSYSSHISSKKCIGVVPVNGRPRPPAKGPQCTSPPVASLPAAPVRIQLREKVDNGRPLQEQLPLNQIKAEPADCEYKPVVIPTTVNGVFHSAPVLQAAPAPQGLVQAVVLPTVGLVSPISINLSDIQNVLKVAVDGNVLRQVLESNQVNASNKEQGGTTGQPGQPASRSVISAISLPIVEPDGTTKIIINYSVEPSQLQPIAQVPKKEPAKNTEVCKAEKLPEDLTAKAGCGKTADGTEAEEAAPAPAPVQTGSTCLLCDECPGGLDALDKLKHCKAEGGTVSPSVDGAEPDRTASVVSSLLSDGGLSPSQPPLKNLLSLLKAYFALNAEPTQEELEKISDSVSLPKDVVKKWFEKMRAGQVSAPGNDPPPPESAAPASESGGAEAEPPPAKEGQAKQQEAEVITDGPLTAARPQAADPGEAEGDPSPPSPLNLSSSGLAMTATAEEPGGGTQAEPLDLSLPKLPREEAGGAAGSAVYHNSVYSVQEEPLNLTCTKKEQPHTETVFVTPPSANPISIVTTQLPTIVAIADQSSVPCLRALTASKQTILIPQLTYSYTASGTSPTGTEIQLKPPQANGNQEDRVDTSSNGGPNLEDHNDSDSTPPRKKMRKTENGMYSCDLCDKIFQKSSSLLRHKYEHTGKRPHECGICTKAFKHKHHLIEHSRLHSGEKPY